MKTEKDWFDIEFSSLPTIKLWDDWEQKILKPLSYLKEMESKWTLEFDLPLVEKKDINVYLDENDMIVVEAKLKERYIDSKGSHKFEYEYFKSGVKIPKNVDAKNISAHFEDGQLTITMPKLYKGSKIEIQ
ncbi:MAG TPA: Hsp20/alpha crystallin family protein [Candidatus Nitrosotenuis sp.]|nr:Hsp20/alpha crystallin family protein [Candidatus Nitrosotenuis sp.]